MSMSASERETILQNTAASAIAAFTLAQLAFWSQVRNGDLPFAEAKRQLEEAVKANSQGGPVNILAAERLQTVLDMLQRSETPRTQ